MTKEEFNTILEMGVYDGKRRYTITDISILEEILFRNTGERYRVRGCSACLETLKGKIKPIYEQKKESIQNAKSKSKTTAQKRRTTKGSSKQNDDSNP